MDVVEMFKGVRNVEFNGHTYCEEVEAELPVFTLTDIPAERWNAMGKKANTKAFIEKFDRQPKDYEEVLSWVYSLIEKADKENHIAGNDTVFETKI